MFRDHHVVPAIIIFKTTTHHGSSSRSSGRAAVRWLPPVQDEDPGRRSLGTARAARSGLASLPLACLCSCDRPRLRLLPPRPTDPPTAVLSLRPVRPSIMAVSPRGAIRARVRRRTGFEPRLAPRGLNSPLRLFFCGMCSARGRRTSWPTGSRARSRAT